MDSARSTRQPGLIAEVLGVADEVGVEVWLRGGWAMDLFLSEITRDHVDIDWFAWAGDAQVLVRALVSRGYRVPGLPAELQPDLAKGAEEHGIALVERDQGGRIVVPAGPWAGEPWPEGMFDGPPGRAGDLTRPIVSVVAQIEIKEMMPVWVPGMRRRAKDA